MHAKDWEKLRKLLRVLAIFESQELGIGEQPHYCAQYAPTDPKHPWNEGSIFVCKRCNKVHGSNLPCHIAMDAQSMNYQNWSYICEITGKTKIPLFKLGDRKIM